MQKSAHQAQNPYTIKSIKARQIYDSRGIPTLECDLETSLGIFRAAVPSGASTGKLQAHELRDGDPAQNAGKSVHKAVNNVNGLIKQKIIGRDCRNLSQMDMIMYKQIDGTKGDYGWPKAKIGANAILSVSMAMCRALAAAQKMPLYAYIRKLSKGENHKQKYVIPCPAFNVINGGKHGGNELAMQQFMILPTGAKSFTEAMQIGTEIYQILKKIIHKKYGISAVNVGDEGGFAPPIANHFQALQLIMQAIKQSNHSQQGKVSIGMDCAASQFYQEQYKRYNLGFKCKQPWYVNSDQLLGIYTSLIQKYPIVSIQDGFDEGDWQAWAKFRNMHPDLQIVGDDLLVTNITRINEAHSKNACNALLLKLNQIGSVSQSIQAHKLASSYNWQVMVSHRSGQTQDTFIAHLVVGLGTGQIKTGAPCRSERLAKYNQLIRIEEQIGQNGCFIGNRLFGKLNPKQNKTT